MRGPVLATARGPASAMGMANRHRDMDSPRSEPGHNPNDRSIGSPSFAPERRDSGRLLVRDSRGSGDSHNMVARPATREARIVHRAKSESMSVGDVGRRHQSRLSSSRIFFMGTPS